MTEIPSEDIEKGLVVKTDPQRTEVVEENAKITVYVSSGKSIQNVSVPSVVGMKKEDAEKQLKDKKLVAEVKETTITAEDKYYPVGYVVKQEPDTGSSQIPEGSTVVIYVSNGVSLDVTVDLLDKDDCPVSTYRVSLWDSEDNMIAESNKINSSKTEYTFKSITSKSKTAKYTVKITTNQVDYFGYLEFTMNFDTGRQSGERNLYEYLQIESDESSGDTDSSDGGTGAIG